MQVLIQFPTREDRLRAIDILAEAEVTYQGVDVGIARVQRRRTDFDPAPGFWIV